MCGPWSAKGLAVGNKLSLLTQKITLCWGYNLLTLRGFMAQSYSQLFPHSYSHPLHSLIRKPFKCYLVARTKQLSFAHHVPQLALSFPLFQHYHIMFPLLICFSSSQSSLNSCKGGGTTMLTKIPLCRTLLSGPTVCLFPGISYLQDSGLLLHLFPVHP